MNGNDEQTRRAFWTSRLDEADAFMRKIMAFPVAECGEPLCPMWELARAGGVEVAFSDLPHAAGAPRLYLLREGLAADFVAAAREMNNRGWVLKVEDAYRTMAMQRGLGLQEHLFRTVLDKVCWECGGNLPPAEFLLKRLGALIAQAPKVGTHMSGSAMDISVLWRNNGAEVDRGAPYLTLSECTPMDSPFVSAEARRNREIITAIMARHGFTTYPWEFWHYNAGDAYSAVLTGSAIPARYGAVHAATAGGKVTPVEDPATRLITEEEIGRLIAKAVDSRKTDSRQPIPAQDADGTR